MCILSFKGYQDKGYKDGAVKDYQLLQHKGLGELLEIKPQPGVSTVCTVNSRFPTTHPVCTIFEMLKVPLIQVANYMAVQHIKIVCSKMSLKYYVYERQAGSTTSLGSTARACIPIVQWRVVVLAAISE